MAGDVFKLFGSIGLKTEEAEKGMKDVVGEAETTGNNLTSIFKKAALAIGTMFAAGKLIDFGKLTVNAAAEAEEFAGAFEQVFKGFESQAEESMANVTDTIKASEGRFKESFLQIAGFGKASGMDTAESIDLSNRAIVAAADYAAMYGGTLEDTAGSLQSFLKGNFANDAALGVSATEFTRNAAAVEMYGEKFNELTETQKQWVLLDMVENANKTSGAMGQAAREADSYANTMGELKNAWNEFLIVAGGPILKAVVPMIKLLTTGVQLLGATIDPIAEKLIAWMEPLDSITDMFGGVKDSAAGATGAVKDITGLVENWDSLTLEEKQAEVNTLGKAELEQLMIALGVDFDSLPDEFSKDAYLNAHGADALEEVLFLTGEWHNLDLEEKEAILKAQIENDKLNEAIEARDLWNDAEFISQLAEINMNDTDAEQQVLDLINYWAELQGLEPAEVEVNAKTEQATEDLEKVITTFDRVKESILSVYDLITGGTVKENTDLLEQMGVSDKVIGVVLAVADGINKIRTSVNQFTTLVTSKAKRVLSQLSDWFEDIWNIIQEINFEQLIELVTDFVANAIDIFTEFVEFLLDFFEPIFTMWKNNVDSIIDLFRGIVTAFNQAMAGDWSGAFETLKTAIGEALTSMNENVMEAWQGIWGNVKDFASSIDWVEVGQTVMSAFGAAISTGVAWLGDVGSSIKTWISDKLGLGEDGSWSDIGTKIWQNIKSGVDNSISKAGDIAGSIRDWIINKLGVPSDSSWLEIARTILDNISASVSKATESAMTFLVNFLDTLNAQAPENEQVDAIVEKILMALAGAIGGLATATLEILKAIVKGILNSFNSLDTTEWDGISKGILEGIKGALKNVWEFSDTIVDLIEKFASGVSSGDWSPLADALKNQVVKTIEEQFKNSFLFGKVFDYDPWFYDEYESNEREGGGRESSGKPQQKKTSWLTPKTASASEEFSGRQFQAQTPTVDTSAVDKLIADVTAKINAAVTTIEELGRNYTAKLIDGMTKGITTNQSKVILNIGILGNNMKSDLDKIHEKANQAVTAGMNKIEFGYRSGLTRARATVRDNLAQITEAFRSQIAAVTKAGEDTGRGFYNGLDSQRRRIVSLAREIAESVTITMERALDINSPSGKTEWIGDMTIDGLYNRMQAGISRIKEVTGQVAGAMLFDPQVSDFDYNATGTGGRTGQKANNDLTLIRILSDTNEKLDQIIFKETDLFMNGRKMTEELDGPMNNYRKTQEILRSRQGGTWA